jgi:hypothetical protein
LQEATGVRSLFPDPLVLAGALPAVRATLGGRAAAAWAAGRAMSREQAVAYARDETEPQ